MYAYDNWKLTDPNDTPERDRLEAVMEMVEEDHPDWDIEEVREEALRIIKREDDDAAEARDEAIQRSREEY